MRRETGTKLWFSFWDTGIVGEKLRIYGRAQMCASGKVIRLAHHASRAFEGLPIGTRCVGISHMEKITGWLPMNDLMRLSVQ